MSKFAKMTLVSDLDGTLIHKGGEVCEKNILKINEFKKLGGNFVIATGRTHEALLPYAKKVGVTLPCIVSNGAGVYDFNNNKYLTNSFLDKSSIDIILAVQNEFKDIGVEIITANNLYVISENKYTEHHITSEHLTFKYEKLNNIKESFMKILFCGEDAYLKYVEKFVHNKFPCINTVRSGEYYYEIMPSNIDKSVGLEFLKQEFNLDKSKIFCIGDYYNDVEMLKYAKVKATTCDAFSDIKSMVDVVVGSSKDGAVADFIEYIIEKFGG